TESDSRYPLKAGTGATGTWAISISGNAATATNGVVTTGSYANPSWLTSLAASKLTGTVSPGLISGSYTGITGVGTLTVGSIPATLLTGTVPSARISGA